jgi:hypothetical protein
MQRGWNTWTVAAVDARVRAAIPIVMPIGNVLPNIGSEWCAVSVLSVLGGWVGGWVVGWLGGWVVGWLGDWVVGWLGGWVVGWLGWVVGWLGGWVAGLCAPVPS